MFISSIIKPISLLKHKSFVFLALCFFFATSFATDRTIDLLTPKDDVSYVTFDKFDAVGDITIDNSLAKAEFIAIQLKDLGDQELKSQVQLLGHKAKIIMVSSEHMVIDGAKFSNTSGVELVIADLDQIEQGTYRSEQVAKSKIVIGSRGINIERTPLFVRAARIEIKGEVRAVSSNLEAYGDVVNKAAEVDYVLDIRGKLTAENIDLVAIGKQGDIRITGEIVADQNEPQKQLGIDTSGDILLTETAVIGGKDSNIVFKGAKFKNQGLFFGRDIQFVLSGDLVNECKIDASGDIDVKAAKSIYNYRHFYATGKLLVKGESFFNELKVIDGAMQAYRNGGDVVAEWIEIYLSGKKGEKLAFSQNFNARMEARFGIRLMAREGGLYIGFRKEMQGEKLDYEGSKLIVQDGNIVIQAAGDIIFDGAEVRSKAIFAESRGQIKEQSPLIIRGMDACKQRSSWCRGAQTPFGCVGGYGYAIICERTSYVSFIFIDGRFFNGEKQVGYRRTVNEEFGAGNVLLEAIFEGNKYFQEKVAAISYGPFARDWVEEPKENWDQLHACLRGGAPPGGCYDRVEYGREKNLGEIKLEL